MYDNFYQFYVIAWVIVGFFTFGLVSSLAEICSAYPSMGALYYWAHRLGGPKWGPFASWIGYTKINIMIIYH